jgi:chromosome segregation ATPase
MKRFVLVVSAISLCCFLSGCTADSHEGLITSTIDILDKAAQEVGNITTSVDKAVTNFKKGRDEGKQVKLDLTEAKKAAEKLKVTGEELQKVKRQIEQIRGSLTEEQKRANAKNKQPGLNDVVKTLLKKQEELRHALAVAEEVNPPASRGEVGELRKSIIDAESPFEAAGRLQ